MGHRRFGRKPGTVAFLRRAAHPLRHPGAGCAGMAALRTPVEEKLGIPVIEPVQAAVSMAIRAVALG